MLTFVAAAALAVLLIAWVGYPIVITLLARGRDVPGGKPDAPVPQTSVVIATRDDPAVVAARVANVLDTEYDHRRVEVVVAVDVTSAWPIEDYRHALRSMATVVPGDAPGGKASALNAGVQASSGDLVVFADSHQRFAPDTIPLLVRYLGDQRFGAVSGTLALVPDHYDGTILGHWWQFELFLRRSEAVIHSLVGVTGAVYCIRRQLWTPLPQNLICDDLFVPLQLAMRGHRVGHCEAAHAFDPRRLTQPEEFRRRVRTLTGILQLCAWVPAVLLPWKNPVWAQFVCHKLLRVATPFLALLVALGVLSWLIRLPATWIGGAALAALLGSVGLMLFARPTAARVVSQVAWALRLLVAPMKASFNAVRGRWDVW